MTTDSNVASLLQKRYKFNFSISTITHHVNNQAQSGNSKVKKDRKKKKESLKSIQTVNYRLDISKKL